MKNKKIEEETVLFNLSSMYEDVYDEYMDTRDPEEKQEIWEEAESLEYAIDLIKQFKWKPIDKEQPEDNRECYIAIQSNITHEIYVEGARYDKGEWVLEIPRYYDEVLDPDHETVLAWQYKKIPKYYGEWRKE